MTRERDALRAQLCAPPVPTAAAAAAAAAHAVEAYESALRSPLRAAAAELTAHAAARTASELSKSGASVRTGEALVDGERVLPSSPRRKSSVGAGDTSDAAASRLLARLVQGMSTEGPRLAE